MARSRRLILYIALVVMLYLIYYNWDSRLRFYFTSNKDIYDYGCTNPEPYPPNVKQQPGTANVKPYPPVSTKHPSPVSSIWTYLTRSTFAYRIAHFDIRTISWGGPVLIALVMHDEYIQYNKPDLYARVIHSNGYEKCLKDKGTWKTIRKPKDMREHVKGFIVLFSVHSAGRPESAQLCMERDCSRCSLHLTVYWEEVNPKLDFAVCLYQPLFQICDHRRVIAWIETNRALGAQKITVYFQESYSNVRKSIEKYVEEGFVEAFSWHQNMSKETDNNYGQALVAFDCLYRNMNRAKYVALFDLDELLVPLQTSTWNGLMRQLDEPHISSFRFCLAYFHDTGTVMSVENLEEINSAVNCDPTSEMPVMFRRTIRTANIDCKIHKWKNIVKPQAVRYVEVHYVVSAAGYKMTTVPIDKGLLFHYRDNDFRKNEPSVEDLVMGSYFEGVMSRIIEKFCLEV